MNHVSLAIVSMPLIDLVKLSDPTLSKIESPNGQITSLAVACMQQYPSVLADINYNLMENGVIDPNPILDNGRVGSDVIHHS